MGTELRCDSPISSAGNINEIMIIWEPLLGSMNSYAALWLKGMLQL